MEEFELKMEQDHIELQDGEEVSEETIVELSNGKGADDE